MYPIGLAGRTEPRVGSELSQQMAVTNNLASEVDLHPLESQYRCQRLALGRDFDTENNSIVHKHAA